MESELTGQVERITYTNEENGYTVAKIRVKGRGDLVTVIGSLMAPAPGEVISMQGQWTRHPQYGEQFKVIAFQTAVPATVSGIQKYLGSGLIKGIGPVMARRIVKCFGKDTLDVIEENAERLLEVPGIGQKRLHIIREAWADQREIRDVMLFLQSHGVSAAYAAKIFKAYGAQAVAVVKDNPYRLAMDIFGIGFITADRIAEKLGFANDHPLRAEAGILYVLHQMVEDGHCFFPGRQLLQKCEEVLESGRDILIAALGRLSDAGKVIVEDLSARKPSSEDPLKAVYLATYHYCETHVARLLKTLQQVPKSIRDVKQDTAIAWVHQKTAFPLAAKQVEAIKVAIQSKIMVITGGPGTGKTTIINAILKIYAALQVNILLAAPTGRAAKRMSETTGHDAKTIHRLLEFSVQKGGFKRNADQPLACDLVIIDEASMIDIVLMYHLLRAIPPHATLILVGDVNQLPSVGAGNVLKDIIASGVFDVVELSDIFRQARESQIIVNAHRINSGLFPYIEQQEKAGPQTDFYFIAQDEPEKVLQTIETLVTERIPSRFGLNPLEDIQVLTPMHRGIVGAENLNLRLQVRLNPGEAGLVRGNRRLRVNDKVMQIKNNYDREVFNGDIGRIVRIDYDMQEVIIHFDSRQIPYDFSDLDEIVLAYAISVHKSQGSEYPAVILPVMTQHYIMLQRNLIYTAITRGRELVIMIGSRKALAIAIRNNRIQKRYTRLKQRLQNL
jgi:exodeoxyribonuclease V alpha subunit